MAGLRPPRASEVGSRLVQATFGPLVLFSAFGLWSMAFPNTAPALWSGVADIGAAAVDDSGWVLPALLALTAGLYALIIGEGLTGADAAAQRRMRRGARTVAVAVASATLSWVVLTVVGACVHPGKAPHLLGVLVLAVLTVTVAVLFGSFEFYSGRERLERAAKQYARFDRLRTSIPTRLITGLPVWWPALATSVFSAAIGAVGLAAGAGLSYEASVILAWIVPALLTILLWWQSIEFWMDRTSRSWASLTFAFSVYVVLAFGYLIIILGLLPVVKLILIVQMLVVAVSSAPIQLPTWVAPWTLNSSGATRAATILGRRMERSRRAALEAAPDDDGDGDGSLPVIV